MLWPDHLNLACFGPGLAVMEDWNKALSVTLQTHEVFVGGMDCEVMPCSTQVWEVWAYSLPTCDNGGWAYSQVMSLNFVYAPTLVHEVMQPDSHNGTSLRSHNLTYIHLQWTHVWNGI